MPQAVLPQLLNRTIVLLNRFLLQLFALLPLIFHFTPFCYSFRIYHFSFFSCRLIMIINTIQFGSGARLLKLLLILLVNENSGSCPRITPRRGSGLRGAN